MSPTTTRRRVARTAAPLTAPLTVVALLAALTACTPNDPAAGADAAAGTDAAGTGAQDATLTVSSTDDACELSATQAPSGPVVFEVTNDGDQVTEFYLLAEDGLRIVSEVENIGPGITRDLVVTAKPGSYQTACKPGMVGDGIRDAFTVTDSGADVTPTGATSEQVDAAVTNYVAYVKDQTEQLQTGTADFVEAYQAGDVAKARELYAPVRAHWERIEPVAESFGDLDPRMDLREADLEEGQEWTGWHLLEKDLWQPEPDANGGKAYAPLTDAQRTRYADTLLEDTQDLYARTHDAGFADQIDAAAIGNGAKGLLDEVATGKVTGEEEIWSHTDLWDFQANVDGAKVAYDGLRDVVAAKDPDLAATLDERFASLQTLLDAQRDGDGFVLYDDLDQDQVRELSSAVDALGEPLSQLTAAVVLR
ncbi:iron uptake system protein EfeO [Cellulomonas sp. PhB143]|uniref:iron uptake system protein EfeO n=1 Tax=Cellulomonas sp. PhB143 TaxID=2485186 RepID=UPI000F483485|nr:iron uptake system protein EfeO [Cellulomonas sp. PhB143]ROS76967.1 iron uptake system component EfeO [Cellulomonas sp. PhB143]